MAKEKSIEIKFTPRDIGRGEWGKKFYISTFRFPLEEAQKFERRAGKLGLTMSSLLAQLIMSFNKVVSEPTAAVPLVRTKHPTIWGTKEKAAFFKKKGVKVPVKRADKPAKKAKTKTSKVVEKLAKKLKKVKAKKAAPKAEKSAKPTSKLLEKLASLRAKNEAA